MRVAAAASLHADIKTLIASQHRLCMYYCLFCLFFTFFSSFTLHVFMSFFCIYIFALFRALGRCKVFLHVNEINAAGLRLYERCGYTEAPNSASNRAFTSSLGLAEGFIGQRHLLLCKTFETETPASASPPSTPVA